MRIVEEIQEEKTIHDLKAEIKRVAKQKNINEKYLENLVMPDDVKRKMKILERMERKKQNKIIVD